MAFFRGMRGPGLIFLYSNGGRAWGGAGGNMAMKYRFLLWLGGTRIGCTGLDHEQLDALGQACNLRPVVLDDALPVSQVVAEGFQVFDRLFCRSF